MQEDLKRRTRQFSIDVLRFADVLPNDPRCWVIGKQLMRSATSVGANDRAACRAQSRAAFIAKMAIFEEEADETLFWMEIIEDLDLAPSPPLLSSLITEAAELRAIAAASKRTAKRNHA
jgi:four helix bundle protein